MIEDKEILTEYKSPENFDFKNEREAEKQINTSYFNDVSVIILLVKNDKFSVAKPYDIDICGRPMWKYIELACTGYPIKTVQCADNGDVLTLIRPLLTDTKYTAVFYSDTPLLKTSTIEEILMYARSHDANVLPLTRGYVFSTEYIKSCDSISGVQSHYFDEEDFMTVYDLKQLSYVTELIKNRILEFHMSNGVVIVDPASTFIDCDVSIEPGAIIEPFNVIKGISVIGKNVKLENFNIITNSIISDNVAVIASCITESRVSEGQVVGPHANIQKRSI